MATSVAASSTTRACCCRGDACSRKLVLWRDCSVRCALRCGRSRRARRVVARTWVCSSHAGRRAWTTAHRAWFSLMWQATMLPGSRPGLRFGRCSDIPHGRALGSLSTDICVFGGGGCMGFRSALMQRHGVTREMSSQSWEAGGKSTCTLSNDAFGVPRSLKRREGKEKGAAPLPSAACAGSMQHTPDACLDEGWDTHSHEFHPRLQSRRGAARSTRTASSLLRRSRWVTAAPAHQVAVPRPSVCPRTR